MNGPSAEVVAAVALAGMCLVVLVAGLCMAAQIMRQISRRLAALHAALSVIAAITDPLTDRVSGIAGNVRNLREAGTTLRQLVRSRTAATDARH